MCCCLLGRRQCALSVGTSVVRAEKCLTKFAASLVNLVSLSADFRLSNTGMSAGNSPFFWTIISQIEFLVIPMSPFAVAVCPAATHGGNTNGLFSSDALLSPEENWNSVRQVGIIRVAFQTPFSAFSRYICNIVMHFFSVEQRKKKNLSVLRGFDFFSVSWFCDLIFCFWAERTPLWAS